VLVDFALQPKGIRQTLLKERFMHAISCRRERSSLVGTNLCYTVTFGGGMDYRVCVNSFRNLYGIFQRSWSRIASSCRNYVAGPMVHGNTGRHNRSRSSCAVDAKPSVINFLSEVSNHFGETYYTRFVCNLLHVSVGCNQEAIIELPTYFSKRQLYSQYCFSRGFKVKPNLCGSYGRISEYELREVDDVLWPSDSMCGSVCSWKDFLEIWKMEFPHLTIRNVFLHASIECTKIKNALYANGHHRHHNGTTSVSEVSTLDSIYDTCGNCYDPHDESCHHINRIAVDQLNNRWERLEHPFESFMLEAGKHAICAQSLRSLVCDRIRESKASRNLSWEERR
jgi:hypothetical protein